MHDLTDVRQELEESDRQLRQQRAFPDDPERPWTIGELRDAFSEIALTDDWRGPIDACVLGSRFDLMAAAVEFMTATKLDAIGHIGNGWVRVKSIGYRAGPAGDH